MAEGLLRKMAGESGLDLEVSSAGLGAYGGLPASPEAVEAAREKGVDLSGFSSRPLGKGLVLESDLILTMGFKHKEAILRKMPSLEGRVYLLSEYADAGVEEVKDPLGCPVEEYRKVIGQMEGYLLRALPKFKA